MSKELTFIRKQMTDSRNLSDNRGQTKNELLEHRMLIFATETIRTLKKHPSLPRSVIDQLTRSAAIVGANYAEACNAASKLDFRNKIFIAKKEAAETRYWLRIIECLTSPEIVYKYVQEAQEILMILQKIINALREKSAT